MATVNQLIEFAERVLPLYGKRKDGEYSGILEKDKKWVD